MGSLLVSKSGVLFILTVNYVHLLGTITKEKQPTAYKALIYVSFVLVSCALFSKFWIEAATMRPKQRIGTPKTPLKKDGIS